ncbi:variable surface protein, partial [Plasmodium gonderi]
DTCINVIKDALKDPLILNGMDIPKLIFYCGSTINESMNQDPNLYIAKCFKKDEYKNNITSCLQDKGNMPKLIKKWIDEKTSTSIIEIGTNYVVKRTTPTKMVFSVCILLKIIVLLTFFIVYNFSKINKFINYTYYIRNLMKNFLHQIHQFRSRYDSSLCSGKKRDDVIYISWINTQI